MNKPARVAILMLVALVATAVPAHAIVVQGGSAGEAIFGTNTNDRLRGGGGNDSIFGKGGADRLFGETGNDKLFGGAGADQIDGGDGDDLLFDDDSRQGDVLRGRDGNDTLYSLDGRDDRVNCGGGVDVAFVDRGDETAGCETVIKRNGNFQGARVVTGSNAIDVFDLNDLDHIVLLLASDDTARGGDGDDLLLGGGGRDSLLGEADEDVMVDDDGIANDVVRPGDGDDVIYAADGARTSIDCSDDDDDGDDDTVFVDPGDAVIDCGTVFRG